MLYVCYYAMAADLQDMTPTTGQLRVVPGSHLGHRPIPTGRARNQPWSAATQDDKGRGGVVEEEEEEESSHEVLLDMKAGDLLILHGEVIHSGTANAMPPAHTSNAQLGGGGGDGAGGSSQRMYISTFTTRLGWPHRDNLRSPGAHRLLAVARGGVPAATSAGQSGQAPEPGTVRSNAKGGAVQQRQQQAAADRRVLRFFADEDEVAAALAEEEAAWAMIVDRQRREHQETSRL